MKTKHLLLVVAFACLGSLSLFAAKKPWESTSFGRPALEEEIKAWDIDVRPDGTGLPEGSGTYELGEVVFEQQCAVCHGTFADSPEYIQLAGGVGSLASSSPVRTTNSKLNHVTTMYDYIYRAMPFNNPKTLTSDEVYSLVAYILAQDSIISEDFVVDKKSIMEIKMPNRNGFTEKHGFKTVNGIPDVRSRRCMSGCADEPKVSSTIPDYAEGAHGNYAKQNRTFGYVRGRNVETTLSKANTGPAYFELSNDPKADHPGNVILENNGCTACHGFDEKKVGPSYNSVVDMYKTLDDNVRAQLLKKIKEGGSGVWGDIPMAPFGHMTDEDINTALDRIFLQ